MVNPTLKEELAFLRGQLVSLQNACESLALTLNAGDVTFAAVSDLSKQVEAFDARGVSRSLKASFKFLKYRALERIKSL